MFDGSVREAERIREEQRTGRRLARPEPQGRRLTAPTVARSLGLTLRLFQPNRRGLTITYR